MIAGEYGALERSVLGGHDQIGVPFEGRRDADRRGEKDTIERPSGENCAADCSTYPGGRDVLDPEGAFATRFTRDLVEEADDI